MSLLLIGLLSRRIYGPSLQVRIGKYKSAGDQLLRRDMSEPQAEQLGALLDTIFRGFTSTIAAARGKTVEEARPPLAPTSLKRIAQPPARWRLSSVHRCSSSERRRAD